MAGTLTGTNLLTRIRNVLQDTTNVRWTDSELRDYINDAQREIVNLRPDSSSTTANVALVAGTKQTLPTAGLRLIKIVRNMSSASGSATGARAIRIVDNDILDTQEPDWHDPTVAGDAAHASVVKHFVFDEDSPRTYYVYPGVLVTNASACFVEIIYSTSPTDLTANSSVLFIDDIYGNAIIDYVLFRAYLKDAEFAGNQQRASTHFQLFATSIGAGGQVQLNVSPNLDAIGGAGAMPPVQGLAQ